MVITVISVATTMVSPMVVNTARSLCWRKASMLSLRLSASFSMLRCDPLPLFSYANDARSHQGVRQAGNSFTIDLHRAGFDLAFRVGSGFHHAGAHQNLRQARRGVGWNRNSFDVIRLAARTHF